MVNKDVYSGRYHVSIIALHSMATIILITALCN